MKKKLFEFRKKHFITIKKLIQKNVFQSKRILTKKEEIK